MTPVVPASASRLSSFAPVLLVVAVVLAYANALNAPFLFDDQGAVVSNPTIRQLASFDVLRPPADGSTTTGRPLVNLSFALNYALSGENVWSYHALNLVIHASAALLLFCLIRRTLLTPCCRPGRWPGSTGLAFTAAALWALHPLQTESVVCIAQRTEILCGFFFLLTLYAFARASEVGGHVPVPAFGRTAWLALSVAACLLGMASKEVMVTAPLIVLLYGRTFVAGTFAAAWRVRRGYYMALVATWLLLGLLVTQSGGVRGVAAGFDRGVTPWSYLLTQADALVRYIGLALWPHPLVLDYGTAVVRSVAEVWWQGLIIVALLGGTVWSLARKPILGFAGAWFFLILAPSSSVVPLVTQTIAEHRMYLPLAAFAVGFAMVIGLTFRRGAFWLLGALVVILAGVTMLRTHDYRDAVAIWTDTASKCPENPRAHHNLALAWQQQGRPELAGQHFARAIALQPDYAPARYNWGVALLAQARFAEADAQLAAARRLSPALQLEPKFAETQFELGRLAEREGQPAAAETKYREVLRLAPDHPGAHAKLALLLARSERLAPAAELLRVLTRLQPGDVDAHANLGNVLLLLGQPQAALASYEAALRLRPDDPRLRENIRLAREAAR